MNGKIDNIIMSYMKSRLEDGVKQLLENNRGFNDLIRQVYHSGVSVSEIVKITNYSKQKVKRIVRTNNGQS